MNRPSFVKLDLRSILSPEDYKVFRDTIGEVVNSAESLALDNASDREVLIARLRRAFGEHPLRSA